MKQRTLALFVLTTGCQRTGPVPAPAPERTVFGPERGSMVIALTAGSPLAPLPGGNVALERANVRFEPDYAPAPSAPTAYSSFVSVPTGAYRVRARHIGYDALDTVALVRSGQTDTLWLRLQLYSGCDICGVIVTTKRHWWQFWSR